jgi:uncharacterized protein YcbX
MARVGSVARLARYPVKSMAGEPLESAFVGYAGVYGDRAFAFVSSYNNPVFPWVTAREMPELLLYSPRFREPDKAAAPLNAALARLYPPGLNPWYAPPEEMMVDVTTPAGEILAIDDPELIARIGREVGNADCISLVRSERALTDCRPISLFAVQTAAQLTTELGLDADLRRFRANIYLDLESLGGFGEETLVGRTLRIGDEVVVRVVERDSRCKIISLDPDTAASDPGYLRQVVKQHDSVAGIYAAVLSEGMAQVGDAVELLD